MLVVKNYFNRFIFLFCLLVAGFFSATHSVSAASLTFVPSVSSYSVNDAVRVRVAVSSDASINAVSAKVSYPSEILSLTSISKAGSIINLWAQEPSYSNSTGTATFEGVILNGYAGGGGTVVTLIFKAKAPGVATLKFLQGAVLANDGNGTELSSTKGTSTVTVLQSTARVPAKDDPVSTQKTAVNNVIKIEELKKNGEQNTPKRFLITPPRAVKDRAYIVAIDSLDVISWIDDGSHIYEAPDLARGIHTIKVTARDLLDVSMSGFAEFSTTAISTPVITDYPTTVYVNDFLIIKGTADPLMDIDVTVTNVETTEYFVGHIQSNNSGKWSFVSDDKMKLGTYAVNAKAITKDGIESNPGKPVRIEVKRNAWGSFFSKLNNYLTIVTPVLALLLVLIALIIYGVYYLKRMHAYLKKKLITTESVITQSFETLEEDMDMQINIFRKIKAHKPLSETERTFLVKFKKDIESAEKVILKEIKDIEKE